MLKVGDIWANNARPDVQIKIVAKCAPSTDDEYRYDNRDDRPHRDQYFIGVAGEADGTTWVGFYTTAGRRLWDESSQAGRPEWDLSRPIANVAPDESPTVDYDAIQYGMELWEAVLEMNKTNQVLKDCFEGHGYSQMRYTVARLVPYAIRDYVNSDSYEQVSFDWDFAPTWVSALDWAQVADRGAYGSLTDVLGPVPEISYVAAA